MPYVPGFTYDLFVSYASEDNVDGWVEKFQAHLTGELARLIGRPFSEKVVFFDRLRLQVGQAYPNELDQAARDSALLVALISPSYAASDWCSRERQIFQEQLPKGAEFAECLAVCRLRPTGPLPATLANAQRADFVIPGFQEPWSPGSGKWIQAVNRLAAGIKDALQKLRNRAGAVFVGSTLNSDMDLRTRLVDYLSSQHFRATPDPPALLDDRAATQKALTEAVCAVHFLGGANDSALTALEDSLEQCAGPTLLFQPFGMTLTAGETFLLDSIAPERYPHRISSNEVELTKFLEELLTRARRPPIASASLSLICDLADLSWAQQFQADELSVDYPRFLQDKLSKTEELRRWRQMVKESHGLLFYHGQSEETFLHRVETLANGEKSRAARKWYLDNPDIEAKRQRWPNDSTYPEGLADFLRDVRHGAGGQKTVPEARRSSRAAGEG